MARYLFAIWPFAGHVHPALAVARALRARGHDAAFYTGAGVHPEIAGEGFHCFPFERVDEQRVAALAASEFPYSGSFAGRLRQAPRLQAKFREWLLETIPQQVEDLDRVMAAWVPDVLVCDLAFWSPILVLGEARRIPVAVLSILAACILPGPDAPFWGQGLPRPRSAAMRLRSRLTRSLVRILSVRFRAEVNAVRRRYNLPPIDCPVTEYAARMPLYLVPSTPAYDYERGDLPSSVQYVGPCLWDKPGNSRPPEWLSQLDHARPLVYVTEATIGTGDPFLLKAAAQGLRNLPVQVVMTAGRQRNPAALDLGPLAPDMRVESYVPQSDLLPHTAVTVTLGGSGGVLASLSAGVPLVVVPTEWDRPENAQRVVEAGAGLRLAPDRCTPDRLRAAVERVLREPSFRENARRLARDFANYGGPRRAAQLLEALVAAKPRPAAAGYGGHH
ncbi:MAG: nucleotide disphospho-sugar-binding domain-containing protein [Candidatus Solibacter sp.]